MIRIRIYVAHTTDCEIEAKQALMWPFFIPLFYYRDRANKTSARNTKKRVCVTRNRVKWKRVDSYENLLNELSCG